LASEAVYVALTSYRQILGADHPATVRASIALAAIKRDQFCFVEAMALADHAIRSARMTYEPESDDRNAKLAPHWLVTEALSSLAAIQNTRGAYGRAIPLLEQCILRQEVVNKELQIKTDVGHAFTLGLHLLYGTALAGQGQITHARKVVGQCGVWASALYKDDEAEASTARGVSAPSSHHLHIADCLFLLADISKLQARYRDAKVQYSLCMAMRQRKLGTPAVGGSGGGPSHHSAVVRVLLAAADNMRRVGYFHDALEACALAEQLAATRSATAVSSNMKSVDVLLLECKAMHAHTHCDRGKGGKAEAEYQRFLTELKESNGADRSRVGLDILLGLARCLKAQNKVVVAEKTFKEALVLAKDLVLSDGSPSPEELRALEKKQKEEERKTDFRKNTSSHVLAAFGAVSAKSSSSKGPKLTVSNTEALAIEAEGTAESRNRLSEQSGTVDGSIKQTPFLMEIVGDIAFLKITARPQDQTGAMSTIKDVVLPYFAATSETTEPLRDSAPAEMGSSTIEQSRQSKTAADGYGPQHPMYAHFKGRLGLFMNMAKKDSGRKIIFESLDVLDKHKQFPMVTKMLRFTICSLYMCSFC
jgi:hypothetical protein